MTVEQARSWLRVERRELRLTRKALGHVTNYRHARFTRAPRAYRAARCCELSYTLRLDKLGLLP